MGADRVKLISWQYGLFDIVFKKQLFWQFNQLFYQFSKYFKQLHKQSRCNADWYLIYIDFDAILRLNYSRKLYHSSTDSKLAEL